MKKFDEGLASGIMLCVYQEYCYGSSAEELLTSFVEKKDILEILKKYYSDDVYKDFVVWVKEILNKLKK